MLKERRTRVLRRIVVGLAVAAFVAPAAQARVDEMGGGTQETTGVAVIHGDDWASQALHADNRAMTDYRRALPTDYPTAVLVGDDKTFAPDMGDYGLADYRRAVPTDYPAVVLVGDDKTFAPEPGDSTVLIHGDDKVIAPDNGNYGLADYRRALPTDYPTPVLVGDDKTFAPEPGDSTVLIHGDDKVIAPDYGNYGLADYRQATPQDYGDRIAVAAGDLRSPSTFDWGDALIGAGIAFALMLLAGTVVLGTRRARPAAA
jgi:hypothetical protein